MSNIKNDSKKQQQHIEMIAKAQKWHIPSWYQSKFPLDYSN